MMSAGDSSKMYEQRGFLDPNTMAEEGTISQKDIFSQTLPDLSSPPQMVASGSNLTNRNELSMDELSYHHHHNPTHIQDVSTFKNGVSAASMDITHSQHLDLNTGNPSSNNNVLPYKQSSWDSTIMQDVGFANHQEHQQPPPHDQQFQITNEAFQITNEAQNCSQSFNSSFTLDPSYPSPNILLHLHQSRICTSSSFSTNPSLCITNPIQNTPNFQHSMGLLGDLAIGSNNTSASSVMNDPLFQLNLQPPHAQALGEMYQSLPHGYTMGNNSRNDFLCVGGDEMLMEGNGVVYHEGDGNQLELDIGVLEFNTFSDSFVCKGREGKGPKQPSTEKQRREQVNAKYTILRNLIPNPTKVDRASVVGDAIEYIRELIRTVNELKILVEKKRCGRERCKRQKTKDEAAESCNIRPYGAPDDGCIRTSWLKRKSKDSVVDVRIIDDEVTIKVVQRKKINFLLFVSKVLDELQLDLHHAAGGHVGEYCSFLFNSKITEGSSVYASAIINRVIEVKDTQYAAAVPHTSSY